MGTYFSTGDYLAALVSSSFCFWLTSPIASYINQLLPKLNILIYLGWSLALLGFIGSYFASKKTLRKTTLGAFSAGGLNVAGGNLVTFTDWFPGSFKLAGYDDKLLYLGVIMLTIYVLYCCYLYAHRISFSLNINSKGGSSTPVRISGVTSLGILEADSAKSVSTSPAKDSDLLIAELGAVIMDIQSLGDYGIKKWQKTAVLSAPSKPKNKPKSAKRKK